MTDLSIEYKDIDDLIPYVNNSRTHSDEQVTQVAASIKEFGFTNPILTDENNGIIAGHGRLMAAKKLKLEQVPTITLKGLSDAQRKAYVIADNKLALNAGWDLELLKIEILDLQSLDFDIDLLGIESDELDNLFAEDVEIEVNADDGLTGSDLPKLRFGRVEVEITEDELEGLTGLYNEYVKKIGSSYGFVGGLING